MVAMKLLEWVNLKRLGEAGNNAAESSDRL